MTTDTEIEIPCIIKIQLRNLRGYKGPEPSGDLPQDAYSGQFGILNDALVVQTIRKDLMAMAPSNFGSCLKNQFSERPGDSGFFVDNLFDRFGESWYECYEADIFKIRIVPLKIKTKIIERKK